MKTKQVQQPIAAKPQVFVARLKASTATKGQAGGAIIEGSYTVYQDSFPIGLCQIHPQLCH